MKKKFIRKTDGGSSGADVLLLGLTIMLLVMFINMVQTTKNIMKQRRDMIDANLTLSLLSVDVADKNLLGNSNIIAFDGTSALRNVDWGNEKSVDASSVKLITDFVKSMSDNFGDTTTNKDDLLIKNPTLFGEKGYMVLSEIVIIDKRPVAETHKYRMTNGTKFGVYQLYGVDYKLGSNPVDSEDESAFSVSKLSNKAQLSVNPSHFSSNVQNLVDNSDNYSWTPGSTWYKTTSCEGATTWLDNDASRFTGELALQGVDGQPINLSAYGYDKLTAETLYSLDRNVFYKIYKNIDYGQFEGYELQSIDGITLDTVNGSKYEKQTEVKDDGTSSIEGKPITDCTIAIKCDIYYDITNTKIMSKRMWQNYRRNASESEDDVNERKANALAEASNLDHTTRVRVVQLKRNDGAKVN